MTSTEVGYLYSGKEGQQSANDQAERREGSGRLHICREACGSDKGNVNQVGYFGPNWLPRQIASSEEEETI